MRFKRPGPPKKEGALRRDSSYNKERLKLWREANPEKTKEQSKRSYGERANRYRKNPAHYLWRTAKCRAKQFGHPFDIEVSDIVVPSHCPILGMEIDILHSNYYNGASLDRVINSKGYIKGNVRVISRKANRLKNDASVKEMENLLKYMKGEV